MPHLIDGLSEIAARYDGFLLDIWGVIHNGVKPYPKVIPTLEALSAARKPVVLLSNAPARAYAILSRIEQIGIPVSLIRGVMTSGEEVWQNLATKPDHFYLDLGRCCLWLGPDRHSSMTQGLELTLTDDPAQADFILNTGPDGLDDAATNLLPILTVAVSRNIPMVCANPDLHVIDGDSRIVCAGQVAKVYENLGGTVRWHGKPFGSVYRSSLGLLGLGEAAHVLAVGDSLRTDIAGARNAGLDSLLIAGGIHADEFGVAPGAALDVDRINKAIGDRTIPTYLARELAW